MKTKILLATVALGSFSCLKSRGLSVSGVAFANEGLESLDPCVGQPNAQHDVWYWSLNVHDQTPKHSIIQAVLRSTGLIGFKADASPSLSNSGSLNSHSLAFSVNWDETRARSVYHATNPDGTPVLSAGEIDRLTIRNKEDGLRYMRSVPDSTLKCATMPIPPSPPSPGTTDPFHPIPGTP